MPNRNIQIRDPIHGFVELSKTEAQLLDTAVLQRLRGIRQLALASLVYPGALHTRFEHSLGVMHVAGQMAKSLDLGEEAIELVRLAALLHDVGHGPFSHVSEYALSRYTREDQLPKDVKQEKTHEIVTASIIERDPKILGVLGSTRCKKITKLLGEGYGEPALRQVVSGPLDADKQDYLLRDSYYCGVKYGVFDIRQLHRSLEAPRGHSTRELMLRSNGVHAVEQYVLAKYYMTTNVYRHKVRLITDQMIVRAIILGIEKDGIDELVRLYTFDNSENFIHNYLQWDDARFMQTLGSEQYEGTSCYKLLQRLKSRRLLKRVFQANLKDFARDLREPLRALSDSKYATVRSELECAVADRISSICDQPVCADFVVLHTFGIKSVKEMSRNDEADILVWDSGQPIFFADASSLFESIQERTDEQFVEVYAPVTWDTKEKRVDYLDKIHPVILGEIEEHCKKAAQEVEA